MELSTAQLARIEEAGLNASATSQQMLYDGWLLRFCPGKAKRARSINAIAPARLDLEHKLQFAQQQLSSHGLPLMFRITPFTAPTLAGSSLDFELAARGFVAEDDTRVMAGELEVAPLMPTLGLDCTFETCDAVHFAETVGQLRGSPPAQRAAHAKRLAESPQRALRIAITHDNEPVCAGQCIVEGQLAGLYDIVTAPSLRGRGLASSVMAWLLAKAHGQGARHVYLQVEGDNAAARSLYHARGMADQYAYHYRSTI